MTSETNEKRNEQAGEEGTPVVRGPFWWWRTGLAVFALMILVMIVLRFFQ